MDFPLLLTVLLVLPFAAAAVIIAVSVARRRGHAPVLQGGAEPAHRLQSDTAAVQDATDHPAPAARAVAAARDRRAATHRPQDR